MSETTSVDLREIIKILKRQSRLILIITFTAVICAAVISMLIPPTYEAETTIRIKQPKGLADSLLSDLPASNGNTKQLMSTYAEILKSRTVVQAVIDKTQQNEEKKLSYGDLTARVTTQPVKDTEILKVKVQAKSPEEAQLLANTLINAFSERLAYLVRLEQTAVREFIGQRLQEAKLELEEAESQLAVYKRDNKIVAPNSETQALVDRLKDINKLSAETTVTLASSQARLGSVQRQLASEKQGFIADSPLIQTYKGKLAECEVKLVSLLQKYTDKHPEVMAMRAAITEIKEKLNIEVSRVVNAEAPSMNPIHQALLQNKIQAEAEIAAGAAQQQAIAGIIAAGEKELAKLPEKEQGLARVSRDVMVAQEIYVMLAKRHEEARISEVMQPSDVQVIDEAIAPQGPIKPNKRLNILIAAILGLSMGTGLAFAREYLNKTIKNVDDVRHYLDLPVIGNIPDFDKDAANDKPGALSKLKSIINSKMIGRG